MAVTPIAGVASVVTVGGTAVTAVAAGPNGGVITNPLNAADQNLAAAEPLFVSPVTDPILFGYGSTFRLEPGQSWTLIPGQDTPTKVNATSAGHRFSVFSY